MTIMNKVYIADSGWAFNDVTIMWTWKQKNAGVVKWKITCCYEQTFFLNVARKRTWSIIYAWKTFIRRLRLLIIGNIISNGCDPETGVFPWKLVEVTRPLGISSAVVSKIWKSYCQDKIVSPKPNTDNNGFLSCV
jgi:hypothetical protein